MKHKATRLIVLVALLGASAVAVAAPTIPTTLTALQNIENDNRPRVEYRVIQGPTSVTGQSIYPLVVDSSGRITVVPSNASAVLAAAAATATLLQNSVGLTPTQWLSAVSLAGGATVLLPSGTVRYEMATQLPLSATESVLASTANMNAAVYPAISSGRQYFTSMNGDWGGKSIWLALPDNATSKRDINVWFWIFKK